MAARARSISESSTNSAKEDEKESSDEADKNSPRNTAQRGKLGDGKEHTKVEGLVLLSPAFLPLPFPSSRVVQTWKSGL